MRWPVASVLIGLVHLFALDAHAHSATLVAAEGDVSVRAPKASSFSAVAAGASIESGSRLKTGEGNATLRFDDGTQTKIRPKTQIIVRAAKKEEKSGLTVFFGRVWTSVVKRVGGDTAFEVHSANAVAGVRGTEFEVGVADDGSTRVIVTRGRVDVGGDGSEKGPVDISAGFEIESNGQGALDRRKKAKKNADWDGWFAQRAKVLVKRGSQVAKNLDGRLDRRRAKLYRLIEEQRRLKDEIIQLERKRKMGADVEDALKDRLAELERVTERLEDMQARLQAAFGLFEHWGEVAEAGMVDEPAAMKRMAGNIRKIAADFADMIEEGTDLSEEGMDDMMRDMEKGGTLRPKKGGAKDELFE